MARTVSATADAAAPWSAESTTCGSGIGILRYADVPWAVVPGAMQVAYLAASTTSAESTARARVGRKEASRHAARPAIRNDAAPRPKDSANPVTKGDPQQLRHYRSKRSDRGQESSASCVVPAGRKLSITATVINEFRCESYQGKGPWGLKQQLLHSGRLT